MQRSALLLNSTRIQVYLHLLLNLQVEKKKPRKLKSRARRWYVRPWIKERAQYGHNHQLLPQLQSHDTDTFRYYFRVNYGLFHQILQRIKPHIQRQDTNWKQALYQGFVWQSPYASWQQARPTRVWPSTSALAPTASRRWFLTRARPLSKSL